jgi:monoamine oxidase
MVQVDNLIVGGGLAGLSLARMLYQSNQSFTLIEARDRLGGRIASARVDGETFDLGPAWFWPGQPRLAELATNLNLRVFEQFCEGLAVYEDEQSRRQTASGIASMRGSYRIEGGFNALVTKLAKTLPNDQIFLNRSLQALEFEGDLVKARLSDGDLIASKVILAIPPRIISQNIDFKPLIDKESLANIPTWMAGHGKALAVYDRPFWREMGLSGDAVSRTGPLMEIHDASPLSGKSGALFGFLGLSVEQRGNADTLREEIRNQLIRIFGPDAVQPKEIFLKDWAFDPLTATQLDHPPLMAHPQYQHPAELSGLYDNRLFFASTEMAPEFGGFLEGAIEAAEQAFKALSDAF